MYSPYGWLAGLKRGLRHWWLRVVDGG